MCRSRVLIICRLTPKAANADFLPEKRGEIISPLNYCCPLGGVWFAKTLADCKINRIAAAVSQKYVERVWDYDWDEVFRRKILQPNSESEPEAKLSRALQSIYVSLFIFRGKITVRRLGQQERPSLFIGMNLRGPGDSDEELLTLNRGCNAVVGPCWTFSLRQFGSKSGIFFQGDGRDLNLKQKTRRWSVYWTFGAAPYVRVFKSTRAASPGPGIYWR